jgi:hypothetical protein
VSEKHHRLADYLDSLVGGLDLLVFIQHLLFVPSVVNKVAQLGWHRQGRLDCF